MTDIDKLEGGDGNWFDASTNKDAHARYLYPTHQIPPPSFLPQTSFLPELSKVKVPPFVQNAQLRFEALKQSALLMPKTTRTFFLIAIALNLLFFFGGYTYILEMELLGGNSVTVFSGEHCEGEKISLRRGMWDLTNRKFRDGTEVKGNIQSLLLRQGISVEISQNGLAGSPIPRVAPYNLQGIEVISATYGRKDTGPGGEAPVDAKSFASLMCDGLVGCDLLVTPEKFGHGPARTNIAKPFEVLYRCGETEVKTVIVRGEASGKVAVLQCPGKELENPDIIPECQTLESPAWSHLRVFSNRPRALVF